MEQMKIKKESLQKLLNYLASRPYIEVMELVPLLQAAEALPQSEVVDGQDQVQG